MRRQEREKLPRAAKPAKPLGSVSGFWMNAGKAEETGRTRDNFRGQRLEWEMAGASCLVSRIATLAASD